MFRRVRYVVRIVMQDKVFAAQVMLLAGIFAFLTALIILAITLKIL